MLITKYSAYLENLLCRFRSSTRSPGTQCSCIRLEQPYARLVLPTFDAGSDVSVVTKHEIQLVLGIFNRHSWSHESIICSWLYRFGWAQKLCLTLYIYFELYHRVLVQRWLCSISLTELFAFCLYFLLYKPLILCTYFYNGYYCSLKLTFNKKRQSCAYCRALLSIATFRHTPRLSSKGTFDSGNVSWIRVFRPESYCTVPYCTDPYRSVETSHKYKDIW